MNTLLSENIQIVFIVILEEIMFRIIQTIEKSMKEMINKLIMPVSKENEKKYVKVVLIVSLSNLFPNFLIIFAVLI